MPTSSHPLVSVSLLLLYPAWGPARSYTLASAYLRNRHRLIRALGRLVL
jgi:hypothetical protein